MNWDWRHHEAWTIDRYRDAEASRLARSAREPAAPARRFRVGARWRFWRRAAE